MTPVTETTSDVISSERVEGTNVYNKAGEKLGSIDDIMIDKRSGQVRYAVSNSVASSAWGPTVTRCRGTC